MNKKTLTLTATASDFYAPEAETVLTAALVMNPEYYPKIREIIRFPDAFHIEFCRQVFSTIGHLLNHNRAVDFVTLTATNKNIDSGQLSNLLVNVPAPLAPVFPHIPLRSLETYAILIAEAAARRAVAQRLERGAEIKTIMQDISYLEREGLDKFFNPKEVALQVIASFSKTYDRLSYPFREIDKATNGIHKGQVVIVACRPATGKSTFLQNVAWSVASQGKKVLFATAEMGTEMIGKRLITQLSHYNLFYDPKLEMPNILNSLEKDAITQRVKESTKLLEETPFYIHEMFTVPQLETVIMEKARDFDLIVVDYIQLLSPAASYRGNYEKITAVSREIHQLAMKYHLPFLVAAQYNRAAQSTQPDMSDLKESGQLEQDADIIISLWNHEADEEINGVRKVRYDILKNRNGYCIIPSMKVLKSDLTWEQAGSLKVGDKIVGFDEEISVKRRHFKEAIVTSAKRNIMVVYKIKLSDGTILESTGEHKWLIKNHGNGVTSWCKTEDLIPLLKRKRSKYPLRMPKYFEVIDPEKTYEAGYLAGAFDGEGHISFHETTGHFWMGFSQNENSMLLKVQECMLKNGFRLYDSRRTDRTKCKNMVVGEGRRDLYRFLMKFRPPRLLAKYEKLLQGGRIPLHKTGNIVKWGLQAPEILSVEKVGKKEIVTLSTSTQTYIAEGFGAHNSYGNGSGEDPVYLLFDKKYFEMKEDGITDQIAIPLERPL